MSTRTHISPYPVLNSATMATSQSAVSVLHSCSIASYEIVWSGTSPVGTITIEVSNSYKLAPDGQTVANAGTWIAVPFSNSSGTIVTSIAVSGNTGTTGIGLSVVGFENIRIVYTRASGTGSITAVFTAKVA